MCQTMSMSLITFAITAVCMLAIVAHSPGPQTYFLALLLTTVASIQLIDAVIWYSINHNLPAVNRYASIFFYPTILSFEILLSYYGVKHFFGWSNRFYEVLLWLFVIIICTSWVQKCIQYGTITTADKDKDGFLVWCQKTKYTHVGKLLFLTGLLFPILMGFPNGMLKLVILTIPTISFIINYTNVAFGSRWCWSSNILSIIILAIILSKK